MKIRLRLIRARPNFYMISDNPNVSLGIVDCSLYTRRIALKQDYQEKKIDMLAYAPVEDNYFETLAKTFVIPVRQKQFIHKNIFNNAPFRCVAIAMDTNSAFTGFFLLKTPSGINNLISDNLENSEGDSQLLNLILLTIVVDMWLPWKQWTFRMVFRQSPLMISKITVDSCLTWLQCKTLLKIVTILNLLENHWDWN